MSEKVLLIDDDERLVSALRLRLTAAEYQVFTASNGMSGLSEAAMFRPDVIVLDVRMPGMSGFEVCRFIRDVPDLCDIPIVILSASVEDSTSRTILEAGGNIFLGKPYHLPQLLCALRQAIDHRRQKDVSADHGPLLGEHSAH